MPIEIHGKKYVTVSERVEAVHGDEYVKSLSITTEVLFQNPVVVKATVTTPKGSFTGISAANPTKTIEKQSPYEVAETSAVGRALGFAGYGIVDGIATADEMVKASVEPARAEPSSLTMTCEIHGVKMKSGISKAGKEYWSHKNEQGRICFGDEQGYREPYR